MLRPAARVGTGARSGHAARPGGPGAARNWKPKARFCAASFTAGATRRDRVVPPPPAGAHPPPDHRPAAPRNRAGHHRRILRLPAPLAAPRAAARQLHGVDGTLQIVRQLQGCEFPAAAWEAEVLPRRVARYQPEYLDQLCLSGEVSGAASRRIPAFDAKPRRAPASPRAAHARRAAGHLPARGRRLAAGRRRSRSRRRTRSRTRRAKCWRRSNAAARRSSPT